MSNKLKPCICGGKGALKRGKGVLVRNRTEGFYHVVCARCALTTGYYTKEAAMKAWNKRVKEINKRIDDNIRSVLR